VIYTDNDRDPLGGHEDEWNIAPLREFIPLKGQKRE
jgi:hypothetical protein